MILIYNARARVVTPILCITLNDIMSGCTEKCRLLLSLQKILDKERVLHSFDVHRPSIGCMNWEE